MSTSVPRQQYQRAYSCLLGAEFSPDQEEKLVIEMSVGYAQRDGGISKSLAKALLGMFRLLNRLEPSMLHVLGSGVLRFNRADQHPYEVTSDKPFYSNIAIFILRLLSRTDYSDDTDDQVLAWMVSAPFPIQSPEMAKAYLPQLHAIAMETDFDTAYAALELIHVAADRQSVPVIDHLLKRRRGFLSLGMRALWRIDTEESRDLAKKWTDKG